MIAATTILEPANRHRFADLRALALGYFLPLLVLGLGVAISAWKRGPDYRPTARLTDMRRSMAAIGVIATLAALFDMFSRGFDYDSHLNLGPFATPIFCLGLLAWWLAVRIRR